jgi:hypothetical protein
LVVDVLAVHLIHGLGVCVLGLEDLREGGGTMKA